jgi:hypothetical protein
MSSRDHRSVSSQGQTVDRVLVHIDLKRAGASLVSRRLAYFALRCLAAGTTRRSTPTTRRSSRPLWIATSRIELQSSAQAAPAQTVERSPARQHGIGFGI